MHYLHSTLTNKTNAGIIVINFPMYQSFLAELESYYKVIGMPEIRSSDDVMAYQLIKQ